MIRSWSRWLLPLTFVVVLACDASDGAVAGPAAATLTVEAPAFADFAAIAGVDYTLTAERGDRVSGELSLAAVGGESDGFDADPNPIWRRTFNLRPERYTVELVARNRLGDALCSVQREFEATEQLPVEVYALLACDDAPLVLLGDAVVVVQGPATANPRGEFYADVACPFDDGSEFGAGVTLQFKDRQAIDFGAGEVDTYAWEGVVEDVPTGACRATVADLRDTTCRAEVDFTVAADQATSVTVILPCE